MAAPRKLLLAVDDSDASDNVLDWALNNVYRSGDEIHLLHVIPIPMPEFAGSLGGVDSSIVTTEADPVEDARHIKEAKEFIRRRFVPKLVAKEITYKVEIVHFLTDNDSIGEAIVKRADAIDAAVVVLAKHQRGKVAEFFLGSVTKYVTQHIQKPLVILH